METISKATIKKMASIIEKMERFKGCLADTTEDEEFLYSFNAVRLLDTIIVEGHFWCSEENDRTFYVYNEKENTLREMTELEDDIYRAFDDEIPFLELDDHGLDVVFIVAINADNSVDRGY